MTILVTGARFWKDHGAIERALLHHATPDGNLIHGDAVGADWWADYYWRLHDLGSVVKYPAAEFSSPKVRNAFMVDTGPKLVLAFALRWASGTGHCARYARRRQIPVVDYGVSTRIEDMP